MNERLLTSDRRLNFLLCKILVSAITPFSIEIVSTVNNQIFSDEACCSVHSVNVSSMISHSSYTSSRYLTITVNRKRMMLYTSL